MNILQGECFVAAMVMILGLAGCSQGKGGGTPPVSTAAAAHVAGPTAFAPFAGTVPAAFPNTQCHLDAVDGAVRSGSADVTRSQPLVLGGWAGDGHGHAARGYLLVLSSAGHAYSVQLATGGSRPDVARALESADLSTSGYNLSADLGPVVAGAYHVYLVNPAGAGGDCDMRFELVVK